VANLFQPKTAVIEYRPAMIDGSYTWYWSLLPLPDESHAFAHGHGKSRGAAALDARQNARKHGYKISQVRIKHSFAEAAARRINALMEARQKKKPQSDPDAIDPKATLSALPAKYWLVSIEAVQAQEVIDYYVIAFDEKDAVERLRKRGVIRPEPEDFVAAVIEVPKSDYDQFLKWQDEFGVYESVSSEAAKAEEPTEAQAEAGNYKKGHVSLFGMDISIENAKGSKRSGVNKQGKKWSVTMPAHYGYICGTKGKDKDHIDVYIGPDEKSEKVYIVNQQKEEGGFDEHKCMICFNDRQTAIKTYDKAFTDDLGPKLRQSVVATTMEKFKKWLESGDTKKPFKSLAESLFETDPDEISPKDYLKSTHRDLRAREIEAPNGAAAEEMALEAYRKALGETFIVDHVTGMDHRDEDVQVSGEFTVKVLPTDEELILRCPVPGYIDSQWRVEVVGGDPKRMPLLNGLEHFWIYAPSFQYPSIDESDDPDAVNPRDYIKKLKRARRCAYCNSTNVNAPSSNGYVYCNNCGISCHKNETPRRAKKWMKLVKLDEGDPDALNPKDYLLGAGPFGWTIKDGSYYLTYEGEPRQWYPDEKNASYAANVFNELNQTKPHGGGLEPFDKWYYREKWGKDWMEWKRPTASDYGRRLRRRRRYESTDPDDIDPVAYLKSTPHFTFRHTQFMGYQVWLTSDLEKKRGWPQDIGCIAQHPDGGWFVIFARGLSNKNFEGKIFATQDDAAMDIWTKQHMRKGDLYTGMFESADPDDPAEYLKTTKIQDCPNCHKNDWEWFTANLKVKSPPRVFRCKNCNLHWRPDMNPAPKSGSMSGCWFPERNLKTTPVYKCPECGSSNTSLPDDEGLVDCGECGIWFNPTHPRNVEESVDPDAVNPKDYIEQIYSSPVPGYKIQKRDRFEDSWEMFKHEKYGQEDTLVSVGLILHDRQKEAIPAWQEYRWNAQPSDMSNGKYFKSFDEAAQWLASEYESKYFGESADPDSVDPRDYLNQAFASNVRGYVTHKRPGFEASWQVSRAKTVAGQYIEIPVGIVHYDPQNDVPPNANPAWRDLHWHAAPNIGDTQSFKSFDEAVRYLAGKYRNRYGDPEIEESGPDNIDPRDYLKRVHLQYRYSFDVDLPGDEGYTGTVDLPVVPPAGTNFDDVIEDQLWQEEFMYKLRKTEIDPDDLPWIVEIRYRGSSSHMESEDPDAVNPKDYLSMFDWKAVAKKYGFKPVLDSHGVEATYELDQPPLYIRIDQTARRDKVLWFRSYETHEGVAYIRTEVTIPPNMLELEIVRELKKPVSEATDPDAVNPRDYFDKTFPVKASMIDFVWALEYVDARAVGVRRETKNWYVYGHIFSNRQGLIRAVKSIIAKFDLKADFVLHSSGNDDEEYNRKFELYIPVHEISPPKPDDYYPPGSHVRIN
jgi:transcription elongation factor Elf1